MIRTLTLDEVLAIHLRVMQRFDDMDQAGVLHPDRLKSAIHRPDAEYFGKELFPTLWEKIGSLTQSIVQEHLFINGNKRTAFACIGMFLEKNGYSLEMSATDAEEMMVSFVMDDRFKGDDGPYQIGSVIEKAWNHGRP